MSRYRFTKSGYVLDKRIFQAAMLVSFVFILSIMASYNFDFSPRPYFSCDLDYCMNPFYNMETCQQQLNILFFVPLYKTEDCRSNCEWCNEPMLARGSYGEKPSKLFENIHLIVLVICLLTIPINHLWHNKGKKIDLGILEYWKVEVRKINKGFKRHGIDLSKIKMEDDDEKTK